MKYLLVLFVLLFIPLVASQTSFFIEENTNYSIKWSCENGGLCSGSSSCNITINYPNSTTLINDQEGTNLNNGFFNYTLNDSLTTPSGEYGFRIGCFDGGLNNTIIGVYEVNPTGIRPSDQKTESISLSLWFIFGLGTLFFIAFLIVKEKVPVKLTYLIFSVLFFLIGLHIISIGLSESVASPVLNTLFNGFLVISWYVYMFLFFFLALVWLFTLINTMLLKKNMDNARRFGDPNMNILQ